MKECPNCATDVPERSGICPICKYEFPSRSPLPWKPVALIVLVVILIPVVVRLVRLLG